MIARVTLLVIALGMVASPAVAQRKVQERFAASPEGYVRVQNIAGSVKLVGWDRDTIVVMGTVHDTPSERFTVQHDDDGVTIGVWDTTVERAEPSHIEVYVPARSRIWIRTGSATMAVGGIAGSLDVSSVGGTIELTGEPGEVFAESMTGGITLDIRTAIARAKTVTGAILLRGTIADATATSVSGNVLVEEAVIDRGRFESVDGELRFVGPVRRGSTLDFVTHGGAVEFLLPATTDADFTISSYEGALRSEFNAQVRTNVSKIKGSERSFQLGSGGARVNVRTFRGRVVIRSR